MIIIGNDSIILKCDSCGKETKVSASEKDKPLMEFGYYRFKERALKDKIFCCECTNMRLTTYMR